MRYSDMRMPFALLLGCLLLLSCSKNEQQRRQVDSVNVKVQKVEAGRYSVGKHFMGTVEEEDGANVSFGVLGTVVRVMVEEGQFVAKDQPLAEVDGQNVRHSYEISLSTLQQVEDAYKRVKDLYDKGTLPEIRMVEMESALTKAKAAEAMSRKSVEEIVLRAPFSGYVASCSLHEGASVTPGLSGVNLVKIDRVKVKFSVPEKEVGKVKVGQTVAFTVSALGDSLFTGRVITRGVSASVFNHSYAVSALVPNPKHVLLPGMVCKIQMESVNNDYVIIVPQQAVRTSGQDKYVWVVRDGKAHRQDVSTGDITNDGVVVETGLSTGDIVIVEGQNKVCEDTQVKYE